MIDRFKEFENPEWLYGEPKEDVCRYCGAHIGWAYGPMGQALMIGVCDKAECQAKAKEDKVL